MTTHVLQFEHYRVLRWNSEMNGLEFSGKLTADAVLLNGNPKVTVGQLKKYVHFPVLLIDASNTPFRITKWETEAKALNIPVHILKGSPAYIVRN